MLMPSRIASFESGGVSIQPDCPACGGPTVRKTASSGPRAGGEFWGCANFPHCHGSIAVAVNLRTASARRREAGARTCRPSTGPRSIGLARPRDVGLPIGEDDARVTIAGFQSPETVDEGPTADGADDLGPTDWGLQPRSIRPMQPVADPAESSDWLAPT